MTDTDKSYYRRRADEEFAAAEAATCPEASRVHQALAERYSAMVQSDARTREADHSRIQEGFGARFGATQLGSDARMTTVVKGKAEALTS